MADSRLVLLGVIAALIGAAPALAWLIVALAERMRR